MGINNDIRASGVYFETQATKLKEPLPRMDIAAFVGLAERGPEHQPVLLEDFTQFREVFGGDFQLFNNAATGEIRYANLSSAVKAFFSNGGGRCWVVRVNGDVDQVNPGPERLDPGLFLDKDLSNVSTGALLNEANNKYYLRGKRLKGFYSLLPIHEATLIALPDAVNCCLKTVETDDPVTVNPLEAPNLEMTPANEKRDQFLLSWSSAHPDAVYSLYRASTPDFRIGQLIYKGKERSKYVRGAAEQPRCYYFRVCAHLENQSGPWSNTAYDRFPCADFIDCRESFTHAPELNSVSQASPPDHGFFLEWSAVGEVQNFVVHESVDPGFETWEKIYSGVKTRIPIGTRKEGVYYFRVRCITNGPTPWSNTQLLKVDASRMIRQFMPNRLLALHLALLRFCAARGDLFATLSLPENFRAHDVKAYVEKLTGKKPITQESVRPLETYEKHALSYAALYHPWIQTRFLSDGDEALMRFIPPDGAVCGLIAGKTIRQGCWMAPANVPFKNVLGLAPEMAQKNKACLLNQQVNVILQEPGGFLLKSADTLYDGPDLRPINVRRLLIFLRRIALREGETYVFQPNDDHLRRLVQRRFEQLLAALYAKGAFAGNTASSAFRVVTDKSVNTPSSLDRGRFIVELRVAPSKPLSFITVRLVRSEGRGVSVEEVQ